MVSWEIVYAKQSLKDARKLAASGLKTMAQELLAVLANDPFQIHRPSKNWLEISPVHTHAASIFSTVSCMKCLQQKESYAFYVLGRIMNEQAHYSVIRTELFFGKNLRYT